MAFDDDIVASNPVFYFPMEETGGTDIFDSMFGFDGAITGSPTFSEPSLIINDSNPSMKFTGTEYAETPHDPTFAIQTNFTMIAWIRLTSVSGSQMIIDNDTIQLYVDSPGVVKFRYKHSGTYSTISGTTVLATGKKYMVGVQRNGSFVIVSVNGNIDGAGSVSAIDAVVNDLDFGRRRISNDWNFHGDIGRIAAWDNHGILMSDIADAGRVYSDSLSDDTGLSEDETVGYPRYESANDTIIIDESEARHGSFRMSFDGDAVGFSETTIAGGPIKIAFTEPVLADSDEEIDVHGSLDQSIKENIHLVDHLTYTPHKFTKSVTDIIIFTEKTKIEWGVIQISMGDTIVINEHTKVGGTLSFYLNETINLVEQYHKIRFLTVTETTTLLESILRVYPISKTEALLLTETNTVLKVRGTHDLLIILEDICSKNILKRTLTDTIAITENIVLHGVDSVDNPTYPGWNTLSESEWDSLGEDQWNNMPTTTSEPDVGFVQFPLTINLKIRDRLKFIETFAEDGGLVHCA